MEGADSLARSKSLRSEHTYVVRKITRLVWRACSKASQALSNQYQYEIREQSCATVPGVAVARQGAQCSARLHRWIKVRSAGHDIPRSTDRWRPERDDLRKQKQGKLVGYAHHFSSMSSFCPPILHSRHFSSCVYTCAETRKLRVNRPKKSRYVDSSFPKSFRNSCWIILKKFILNSKLSTREWYRERKLNRNFL